MVSPIRRPRGAAVRGEIGGRDDEHARGGGQRLYAAEGGGRCRREPASAGSSSTGTRRRAKAAERACDLAADAGLAPRASSRARRRDRSCRSPDASAAAARTLAPGACTAGGAQREASRLQSAVDRAREHLTEVETARDEARRSLDALEAENTAQLIADLATGSAGRVDPVAGETRVRSPNVSTRSTIASRASDKLASDLAAAQQHLEAAVRAVMEAVCAVLLAEAERQAVAILAAVEALDDRRRRPRQLGGRDQQPTACGRSVAASLAGSNP